MSLERIRQNIDYLDCKIIRLLNERMEHALMARKLKTKIEDPEREKTLLQSVKRRATGLINGKFIEDIYLQILKQSKRLQEKEFGLIAFQGEHGAYGEVAARKWNEEFIPIPFEDFSRVFESVDAGLADYGIVPVENTLGGSVEQVNRLILDTDLHVVGAIELPINLCLLALPDTDHREIRTVYSHPQALAQARNFLKRNKLEPVQYYDTAGAAKMLMEQRPRGSAAIASKLCAELYHLKIIKEAIENHSRNRTRFLVLSRNEKPGEGDKCSIVFSTEHKAGTLFRVLEIFAKNGINLTRIESIPHEPGEYAFFLDFTGSLVDEIVTDALEEVKENTTHLKILGCYKESSVE
ncbi:MAG: bifunctional chorismate mutase/prephenate dehydratase [Deltaproteobacteria bacterium]|nr:bifunctional chorismate mutase/prephenate dehydratase [Deltaproteobacteria bacterium]MBW2136208.1 bifunctional chorismate mutase/prephenate dehydratase [Deltaproteobacteria bacterium]